LLAAQGGPAPRPDATPPAAPEGFSAVGSVSLSPSVTLDWTDGAESDLAAYTVSRATAPGGPYALLATTGRGVSSYVDSAVANATTYYYVVGALDTADNESPASPEASATPRAPMVAAYRPEGYSLAAGVVYAGRGSVTRMHEDDGSRVEISGVRTGGAYVSELQPYVRVTQPPALLRKLSVTYNGGASSSVASLSVAVYRWSTGSWTTFYGPKSPGTTGDVTSTWTTSSPADFVSSTGEVKVKIRATRSLSFRTTTDLVRLSVEY
jgi:hypothetical protein